jgi:hypothetical protein
MAKSGYLSRAFGASVAALLMLAPTFAAKTPPAKNSWRGIVPLHSSGADVARVIGAGSDGSEEMPAGPFKVDGGEVSFSYLTPSLAKLYRAPRSLIGKVFTIYFKPDQALSRADLALGAGFKRCQEEREKTYYYYVSTSGVAYQLLRASDRVETIIYQPSSVEIRRLAVNTECVF